MNELLNRAIGVGIAQRVIFAEVNLLRELIREHRQGGRPPHRAISCTTAACIAAGCGVSANAGEPPEDPPAAATAAVEPRPSPFSLSLNLDATTAYFYRGIMQEDSGPIIQPGAQLTFTLCDRDDLTLDAFIGTWHSFHGQKTWSQTDDSPREYWYEADASGGFTLTSGNTTLTTTYILMTSPNNGFESVQELDFTLSYDDADLHGPFAINPYATLAFELGASGSDGADSDRGIYLELGIAPGFTFDLAQTPITVTFPASIGLSIDSYYQDADGNDDTLGFAQVGIAASLPLTEAFGEWTLKAGLSAMHLGDNTADFNGGQDFQFIATVGLEIAF